ncbi:AEBP2 [Branchiostoma lanceolatum]|uniref:AEBP2 protein n=1 Tax=Branchiostoma lanceolatum TaxID=7740 RepID=A0A8K0AEK2_BRALA|nr:AEBP2 [Branchiostoma lanceolatum]
MADSRPKEHSLRSKHLDNSLCLRHSERLSARERTVATTKVPTGDTRTLRSRDIRPEKREECGLVGRGGPRTKKPTQPPPTSPVRVSARLKENTAATIPPLSAKHGRRLSETDASPYGTRKRSRSLGSNHNGSAPSPGEQAFRIATRLREKLSTTTRATVTDSDLQQQHHHPGTNLRAVVSLQKLECPAKGRVTTTDDQRKSSTTTTTSKHNGISGKLDSSERMCENSVLASTCEDRRSEPDKNANQTLQLNCIKHEITDGVENGEEILENVNEQHETASTLINHDENMEVGQQDSETPCKETASDKTIENATVLGNEEARKTHVNSSENVSTNGISTPCQPEIVRENCKQEATAASLPSVQKPETQSTQETNSQQDSEDSRMTMDDESQSSHSSSANDQNSSASQNSYTCKWEQCDQSVASSSDLADHLSNVHVREEGEKVVCLWRGCRVYNMPARSRSWLSRHVLQHSGDRPFKCMIEGCRAAFASQGGLARHVPTHFVEPNTPKSTPNKKDESPSKSTKRKKTRFRRRTSIVRTEDFFDTRIMDMIRQKLVTFNMMTYVDTVGRGQNVVFRSQVLGRRVEPSGQVKLLLRWVPENVLPDVWVDEAELPANQAKLVPLTSLPAEALISLDSSLYRNISYANFRK